MAIAATTSAPLGWSARIAPGRDLTIAGLGSAALRLSAEQVSGQAVQQAGHDVAAVLARALGGRFQLLDLLLSWLGGLDFVTGPWHGGPLAILATLVVPVGGPAWGGLVPLRATCACVTAFGRLVAQVIAPRVPANPPASGHAWARPGCDAGGMSLSVLIVDDSAPFREVARQLLERGGLTVVGVAGCSAEAVEQIDALAPQVVLLDIHLADESGFDLARKLGERDAGTRPSVVLMSTHSEADFADLIAQSPVVGFVPKERLSAAVVRAKIAADDSAR